MNYAIEMGWDGMILVHVSGFLKTGSAVQKLIKGDTQHGDGISLLSFFQTKGNRIETNTLAAVHESPALLASTTVILHDAKSVAFTFHCRNVLF
jgi:hypothetical protein